jgi:hypothetical protein
MKFAGAVGRIYAASQSIHLQRLRAGDVFSDLRFLEFLVWSASSSTLLLRCPGLGRGAVCVFLPVFSLICKSP